MATDSELKQVIKETLESRGTLGQIKARLRAEVFNVIDDKTEQKPILTNENLLINELIREYLEFNQYKYTCSVLLAESDQPDLSLDRKFIEDQLNVSTDPDAKDIPLLYSIMAKLKKPNTKRSVHPFTKDDQSHGDALIFRGSKP